MNDIKTLPADCFMYQRPSVIVPPLDYLDLDLALLDAAQRNSAETAEIEMVNNPVTGPIMEYTVMAS